MQDLGTLGTGSSGSSINNRGQVVGYDVGKDGEYRSFIWTPEGGMRELDESIGLLPDINDRSEVVTAFTISTGDYRAGIWRPNNHVQLLGTLGSGSSAAGINSRG